MKVLFVTGLYPEEYIKDYNELSLGNIQNAPNVFQWNIVEGLYKNNISFKIVTFPFLPSYPNRYKNLYTINGDVKLDGNKIGDMVSYCNLIAIKTYSIKHRLQRYIYNWVKENEKEDELIIITYTTYSPFIDAVKNVKRKFPNIKLASIITDLVDDMMNFASNRRNILKRLQSYIELHKTKHSYKYIDKFILLSKHMTDKIPEAIGRNIVVEGVCNEKAIDITKANKNKTILYAGTLQEFSGVRDLINAFIKIKNPDYRLVICGMGILTNMIIEASQKDPRIIYKGIVSRDIVLSLQKDATILINPRKPNGSITRYSFPSKTMEYLSSGTPMIGYKLEGIPSEYYNHFYTINDLSEETLIKTIENTMSLPQEVLNEKAYTAYNFIMENKTSQKQVKRILNFLGENKQLLP